MMNNIIRHGNYWYEKGNKVTNEKYNHFYLQKQFDTVKKKTYYDVRKIIKNFDFDMLFKYEKYDYYPININVISDLYEIKDTNNPALKNIIRLNKLKRILDE